MLTQRESDTALVEADLWVQKLLEEWARDYLGSRYGGQTVQDGKPGEPVQNTEGSGLGSAEGAGIDIEREDY